MQFTKFTTYSLFNIFFIIYRFTTVEYKMSGKSSRFAMEETTFRIPLCTQRTRLMARELPWPENFLCRLHVPERCILPFCFCSPPTHWHKIHVCSFLDPITSSIWTHNLQESASNVDVYLRSCTRPLTTLPSPSKYRELSSRIYT